MDNYQYFNFLVNQYNFTKLPEYQFVREIHNDFSGNGLVIKLIYEGGFSYEILKPKFDIIELLAGFKRTVDYDYNE